MVGLLSLAALAGATIAQNQEVKGVRDPGAKINRQSDVPPNSVLPVQQKPAKTMAPAQQAGQHLPQPALDAGSLPTVGNAARQVHPLAPGTEAGVSLRDQLQQHIRQPKMMDMSNLKLSPKAGANQPPNNGPTSGASCSGSCSAKTTQSPNQVNGYFCDDDYAPYHNCDDFVVSADQNICDVTFWGAYYGSDSSPADSFTINVHADAGGYPGGIVYSESGVAPSRFQTGVILFGSHEWQYDWVPAALSLTTGTYWLEITQNAVFADIWFWETGAFGAVYNGHYFSSDAGASWGFTSDDLSMVVCGDAGGGGGFTCSNGNCAVDCEQDPNQANGYGADCAFPETLAEDFQVSATKDICAFTFWGIYLNNTAPPDNFTILVHSDAGAFPGGVVYSESNVAPSRFYTGINLFGFYNEYQYEWVPATTLRLSPGTYWLEIYNCTGSDVWYWETANLGSGKIDGAYYAFELPGVNWNYTGAGVNFALAVCDQDQVGGGFECANAGCDTQCLQTPDQQNGWFSDSDYGVSEADDFVLTTAKDICEVTFWGAYYAGDSAPADDFTVLVHSDAGAFPGAVVYSESGVVPSRFQTGVVLFGVHEWQYSWVPATQLRLAPGTYWLEIFQNNASPDIWFWETGALAAGKIDGHYYAFEVPGVNWNFSGGGANLAFAVCGEDQSVPLCSGDCQSQSVQMPNAQNGFFSEDDCNLCGGDQVLADNFTLGAHQDICDITVWGGYYFNDTQPTDNFTVNIHADNGGIPGGVVCSESGLQPSRFQTGAIIFGIHEWQYDFVLSNTCRLAPGVYWIEIYNAISGDDWLWETANGGDGLFDYAFEAPGVNWNQFFAGTDLAMVVCTQDQPIEGRECPRTCDMRTEQFADAVNGYFSDEFCDLCGGVPQVISDNVVLTTDAEICQIVVTGGYFPNNSTPTDDFTVRILADTGSGIPDDATVLYCESPQFTYRNQTGNVVFGVDEWKHTLIATTPWVLGPGVYWIEVYNNVVGDDWFWETGTLDTNGGVSGSAFAFEAVGCSSGGTNWNAFGGVEFALQLCGKDPTSLGQNYCPIVDNSAPGAGAALSASGDTSVSSPTPLTLTATDVPNQFGIFYNGENPNQIPFGNGFQCVTGGIVRGAVVHASGNTISYSYDESDAKHSLAFTQGLSRRFQYWFRDPSAGGAFFNLSDAMCIFIRP
jgi:hypothetical protein